MEAPRQEGGVAYSFTHFYRDALDAFRETRGLVLTLRQAHYLVGGGGDTNSEPAYEKGQPRKRPPISQGIKCIAVERNLSAAQNNVWSGLFLSHAQGWKPIAGRCVLVRARYNTYQSRFRGQKGIPKSAEV
jgi:hypothetical protein